MEDVERFWDSEKLETDSERLFLELEAEMRYERALRSMASIQGMDPQKLQEQLPITEVRSSR